MTARKGGWSRRSWGVSSYRLKLFLCFAPWRSSTSFAMFLYCHLGHGHHSRAEPIASCLRWRGPRSSQSCASKPRATLSRSRISRSFGAAFAQIDISSHSDQKANKEDDRHEGAPYIFPAGQLSSTIFRLTHDVAALPFTRPMYASFSCSKR